MLKEDESECYFHDFTVCCAFHGCPCNSCGLQPVPADSGHCPVGGLPGLQVVLPQDCSGYQKAGSTGSAVSSVELRIAKSIVE